MVEEPTKEALAQVGPVRSERAADRFMRRLLRTQSPGSPRSVIEARNALRMGITLSGVRCLFTYLIFPALGPALGVAGALRGPLALALGGLAVLFSVRSMRRFWMANHRHRWAYTAFAALVIGYVVVDVAVRAWAALT